MGSLCSRSGGSARPRDPREPWRAWDPLVRTTPHAHLHDQPRCHARQERRLRRRAGAGLRPSQGRRTLGDGHPRAQLRGILTKMLPVLLERDATGREGARRTAGRGPRSSSSGTRRPPGPSVNRPSSGWPWRGRREPRGRRDQRPRGPDARRGPADEAEPFSARRRRLPSRASRSRLEPPGSAHHSGRSFSSARRLSRPAPEMMPSGLPKPRVALRRGPLDASGWKRARRRPLIGGRGQRRSRDACEPRCSRASRLRTSRATMATRCAAEWNPVGGGAGLLAGPVGGVHRRWKRISPPREG